MLEKFKNLPLRKGVGIVLLNSEDKVFVAKRIDNPKDYWQMPQGGIDKNEDFLDAALRELKEETSIENVELIKEIDGKTIYELPDNLLGIIWKGRYRGQEQKWFLMRFKGKESEINLNTHHPEFLEWRWVELDEITKYVVKFKLDIYKKSTFKVKKIITNSKFLKHQSFDQ